MRTLPDLRSVSHLARPSTRLSRGERALSRHPSVFLPLSSLSGILDLDDDLVPPPRALLLISQRLDHIAESARTDHVTWVRDESLLLHQAYDQGDELLDVGVEVAGFGAAEGAEGDSVGGVPVDGGWGVTGGGE